MKKTSVRIRFDSTNTLYQFPPLLTTSILELIFMKGRKYYERLYAKYPDVVTTAQLCKMLGGIADSTARKLIRSNHIKHYHIRGSFLIPKICVIDYVLSNHYQKFREKLRTQV